MGIGRLALVLAAGLAAEASAGVVVFDFESFAGNDDPRAGDFRALSLESDGLFAVLKRTTDDRFTIWNSHGRNVPSVWGAKHLSPVFNLLEDDYMEMSFSKGLDRVTIEFGDYGQDNDLAELWAYSEIYLGGDLIGSASDQLGANDIRWDDPTSVTFVAPAGEQIWSIKFRGGQDPFFQSTFIDNIVVDVIPTPGTLAVLGLGCAGVSGRLRRRG